MRVPKVLTGLGIVLKLEITTNDDKLIKFDFKIKDAYQLTSNSTGTALFIFPWNGRFPTDLENEQIQNQLIRADKLYSKWTDFESEKVTAHNVTDSTLEKVGFAYSITYRSDKWSGTKTDYIHHFDIDKVKVLMDKENSPKMIQIFGGKLKVRAEGITG